jgi:hypothetical protein
MTPTVHVLLCGRVLCGSVHGFPRDWGPEHRWVHVEERGLATCATCKDAALLVAVLSAEADRVAE